MRFELTLAQHEVLTQILEESYRELMLEIRHARHHHQFREALREREKIVEGIIDQLGRVEKVAS
jgi:hypothetical protein